MKLIKGKNANRGFTLVELIVVMALSIMVLTLMVSMLSIFTTKVEQNKFHHGFYDEVSACRDEIQEWLAKKDNNTIALSADITVVNRAADESGYMLQCGTDKVELYGSEFTATGSDKIYLNFIERIEFTIFDVENSSADLRIIQCEFIGKDPYDKEYSQSMLFCVETDGLIFKYKH